METITHKRGSAFQWIWFTDDIAPGEDLTGSDIHSHVKSPCGAVIELVAQWIVDPTVTQWTQLTTVSTTNTGDWPTGELKFDILFVLNGQNIHTSTGCIDVQESMTVLTP